jgi:hypothetical protein
MKTWVCNCPDVPDATPDHRPARRVFANGTIHWGMWCRTCGAWDSRPRDTVQQAGADTFNEAVREAFRHQQMARREHERAEQLDGWRAWYFGVYLKTEHWERMRAAVLKRDPICRGCGRRPSEHAHHRTYNRLGCELLTDLIGYCRKCHEAAHRHNVALCPCADCIDARGGSNVPSVFAVVLQGNH